MPDERYVIDVLVVFISPIPKGKTQKSDEMTKSNSKLIIIRLKFRKRVTMLKFKMLKLAHKDALERVPFGTATPPPPQKKCWLWKEVMLIVILPHCVFLTYPYLNWFHHELAHKDALERVPFGTATPPPPPPTLKLIFFSRGLFFQIPNKKAPVSFLTGAIFVMTGATFSCIFFSLI